MAGATVKLSVALAPLLYVSPTQINFVVLALGRLPFEGFDPGQIFVDTPRGRSVCPSGQVVPFSPGIFTANGTGCGQAAP